MRDKLFAAVDAASLGAFRILFGALMLWEVYVAFRTGHVRRYYIDADILFPYELFPFVRPWPGPGMYVHFALMGAGALGILLGLFYRFSAGLFLVTYAYAFLLDKGCYNNHYYLIILLAFLMLVVDAHRWGSLDQWRHPRPEVVPFWNLFLLRAQIVVVFFYGGIAKLNLDWLSGEPMRTWLATRGMPPWLASWLRTEPAAYFFSYGGMIFDLVVGFLLLSRRLLPLALVGLIAFNLSNHWLFRIGVFPFLVLAAAVLFAPPDLPRRLLGRPTAVVAAHSFRHSGAVVAFIAAYVSVQLLVPLRHWLYPGEVSWTEEGHRFSWHMKLRSKKGRVAFWVTDPRSGETWRVEPTLQLTAPQRRRFKSSPDMMLQYVHYLRRELKSQGIENPIIRADAWLSLNRRPPQTLIDPGVDLARTEATILRPATWIVPLDQSGKPGSVPLAEYRRY